MSGRNILFHTWTEIHFLALTSHLENFWSIVSSVRVWVCIFGVVGHLEMRLLLNLNNSTRRSNLFSGGAIAMNSSVSSRGRAVSRPVAVIPPPSSQQSLGKRLEVDSAVGGPCLPAVASISAQKPVPPPRHSLIGGLGGGQPSLSPGRRDNLLDGASVSPNSRTPSPGDASR